MTTIIYPPKPFHELTRQQLLTTCIALEEQRDRALAQVEALTKPIEWHLGCDDQCRMHAGYYSEAKTAIYREGFGAVQAYGKHVDGYRIDGVTRFQITSMSPWEFAGLLGDMVDAGVTNTGAGETFFANMRRAA